MSQPIKNDTVIKLLLETFTREFPEFSLLHSDDTRHLFQRIRYVNHYPVYEIFHVTYHASYAGFTCSVASCMDQAERFAKNYSEGLLNPHFNLLTLKNGKSVSAESTVYKVFQEKSNSLANILNEIVSDYREHGLQFLNYYFAGRQKDKAIFACLEFIESLPIDKRTVLDEFYETDTTSKYLFRYLNHPVYAQLHTILKKKHGRKKNYKRYIPELAEDLICYYAKNIRIHPN